MSFSSKIYETLLITRSDNYKYVKPALEYVGDFVKGKKRILYGGTAINMALKKAGAEGIYSDEDIPDYDFYSPESVEDSIELADILHEKSLPNISAINGMHQITRRVRTNFVNVADISYVPANIYDKIPTLEYEGFRICHPHYQMIDQHRSLSYPLENPPLEPVNFRMKKDITRYQKLVNEYPIKVPNMDDCAKLEPNISLPIIPMNGSVLAGLYAYAYYYSICPIDGVIKASITADGVRLPERYRDIAKQVIITDDFQHFTKDYNGPVTYKTRISGLIPRSCETADYIIYDNKGELICANEVSGQLVVCAQWMLGYCLSMYFICEEPRYLEIYKSIEKMIGHLNASSPSKETILTSPLFVNPSTYGSYNWGEAFLNQSRDKYSIIHQSPHARITADNYYPARGSIVSKYNYSLFNMGGNEVPPFTPTELWE